MAASSGGLYVSAQGGRSSVSGGLQGSNVASRGGGSSIGLVYVKSPVKRAKHGRADMEILRSHGNGEAKLENSLANGVALMPETVRNLLAWYGTQTGGNGLPSDAVDRRNASGGLVCGSNRTREMNTAMGNSTHVVRDQVSCSMQVDGNGQDVKMVDDGAFIQCTQGVRQMIPIATEVNDNIEGMEAQSGLGNENHESDMQVEAARNHGFETGTQGVQRFAPTMEDVNFSLNRAGVRSDACMEIDVDNLGEGGIRHSTGPRHGEASFTWATQVEEDSRFTGNRLHGEFSNSSMKYIIFAYNQLNNDIFKLYEYFTVNHKFNQPHKSTYE